MKIESIKFKNINNLKGEHWIDFNASAIQQSGIFIITGNTGSGKTTILDAISLALYGKTPRFKDINSSANPIMTKGTGDCYSTVSFTSNGKTYESTWQQRRARRTAEGRLGAQEVALKCITTGELIASSITEWNKAIPQITGLDYERFSRTVILSQGNFDKFMKASKEDKSKILEQITGTQIYSQISKKVFETCKEKKITIDTIETKLEGIKTLSEQEIAQKEEEKSKLEKQSDLLEGELSKIKIAQDYEDTKAQLDTYTKESQVLQEKLGCATALKEQLSNSLVAFETEKDKIEKILLEADKLDVGIKGLETNLKALEASIDKNKTEKGNKELELKKTNIKLEETGKNIQEVTSYLKKNKKNENIDTALAQAGPLLNSFNQVEKDINPILKNLIKYQKDEVEILRSLKAQEQESLNVQLSLNKNDRAMKEAKAKEQEILSGKLPEDIKKQLDQLKSQQIRIDNIDDYDEARTKLQEGEICPLCGSVHHPYITPDFLAQHEKDKTELCRKIAEASALIDAYNLIEEKIRELVKEGTELNLSSTSLDSKIENLNYQLTTISENRARIQKELNSKKEYQKQLKQRLDDCFAPFGTNDVETLAKRSKAYKANVAQLNDLNAMKASLTAKGESLKTRMVELLEEIAKGEKQLSEAKDSYKAQVDKRNLLFTGDTKAKRAELSEELQKLKNQQTTATTAFNTAQTNYSINSSNIETCEAKLLELLTQKNDYFEVLDLKEKVEEINSQRNELLKNIGSIRNELERNEQDTKQVMATLKELEKAKIEYASWSNLNNYIGSADGKKFMEYAQLITFKELIKEANLKLKDFQDRYLLIPSEKNDLSFDVVDNDNNGERRPANGLSGGETFITSLALALGLSSMNSSNLKIESFFLDEGFGTLDQGCLESAIHALGKIVEQGKVIGIISHVEKLAEAIPVQLNVHNGTITGAGVVEDK